ncbi:HD-domain/PDEase-like protein [Artomyces pyxidatus]|uniref:HD-domain/PDEase-like protein n=1 Tax=Artomyces pyxidatus TaxID=48021 RepID=A0ACB8T2G9_9AGAM|nr:HD-domain/PDEase-like protein [Artomyces pyxidatus]
MDQQRPSARPRSRAPHRVEEMRSIKDPVHDFVLFEPHVWRVVDTVHFQRLRSIKQLGTSYYVWSGASHNRFEHSLGVAYLARQMAVHLKDAQPDLGISDRDVRCVELAGLCHDLGHGPWSHVWDSMYIPRALKGKKWQHEDASEMMFDDMINKYKLDIPPADVLFIKALIAGDKMRCKDSNPPEKAFLFEIVANKCNGIDVDKFDYIVRDGRAIGDNQNLSLNRLINSARVIEDQICYDIKDANQIYELCYSRFSLHKRIYNHKTAKAIEHMLIDAIMAAESHLKIADRISDPKKYLGLTDDIMTLIEHSEDPELEESRRIIRRVRDRDLYKCVDYKVFDWEHRTLLKQKITAEAIVAEAKLVCSDRSSLPSSPLPEGVNYTERDENDDDAISPEDVADLTADHVIVEHSKMHYGMQDKNPLDYIKFYHKNSPNHCAKAQRGDLSTLMPATFGEVLLRVYTKDIRFFGIVQAGYRSLIARVATQDPDPDEPSTDFFALSQSPPVTDTDPQQPLSKVGSFKKTKSISAAAGGDNDDSFINKFTTVPKTYGKQLKAAAPPVSPTKVATDAGNISDDSVPPSPIIRPLASTSFGGGTEMTSVKRHREEGKGQGQDGGPPSPPKKIKGK